MSDSGESSQNSENENKEQNTPEPDQHRLSSSVCPICKYRFRKREIRKIVRPWRCVPVIPCPNCKQAVTAAEHQVTRLERGCRWVRRGIGLGILFFLMKYVFEIGGTLAPALGLVGIFLFIMGIIMQRVDGVDLARYVEEEDDDIGF